MQSIGKRIQVIEATWECPYCSAKGKKWIKQREARKIVSDHVDKYHRAEKDGREIIIRRRKISNRKVSKWIKR